MKKYLIFFSFFFTLRLVSAPFLPPQKPDESLAREAYAAALRGVYYLVSQQDGKGNFSSDPGLDRAVAALTESFSDGEPELKTALSRWKRNTGNVVPQTKISGNKSAEPYRDLLELARLLRKLDSGPLLPGNFRSWRVNTVKRLLEMQQHNGSWGNDAHSTFYALCCLRLIL